MRVNTSLSADPLDVAALTANADDPRAGAVASFLGVVRNHDDGAGVTGIDYSSHPSAADELRSIGEEVAQHPEVHAVELHHRVGHLEVGDVALVAVVAAEHRAEAFDACRDAVEQVKRRVPIWKRQEFTDGSSSWSNLP